MKSRGSEIKKQKTTADQSTSNLLNKQYFIKKCIELQT